MISTLSRVATTWAGKNGVFLSVPTPKFGCGPLHLFHIHTAFSADAPFYSVDERAYDAKYYGYGWIILSDHTQHRDVSLGIGDKDHDYGANEWVQENMEAASAAYNYGIPVINDEEISTKENFPGKDANILGYGLTDFFKNYYPFSPNPYFWDTEFRSGTTLVEEIKSSGGFSFLPHPYIDEYPWVDWDANYKGIELASGWSAVTTSTLNKWDTDLAAGKKITGVINSDSHFPVTIDPADKYGTYMTYLYMPNGVDRNSIYNALQNGRAVASTDGSLGVFTASVPSNPTPAQIGETLYADISGKETITLNIQALGVDGNVPVSIKIISNYAAPKSFGGEKTLITLKGRGKSDYPYPTSSSGYFRVEVEFTALGRTAYANPIRFKQTGSDGVIAPITNFSAYAGSNEVALYWSNPNQPNYAATRILRSTTGFATSPSPNDQQTKIYESGGSFFVDSWLPDGVTYYYTAFAKDSSGNWSTAATVSARPHAVDSPPGPVTYFRAEPGSAKTYLFWNNPIDSDYAATRNLRSTIGYASTPDSTADQELIYEGQLCPMCENGCDTYGSQHLHYGEPAVDTSLTTGVTYYYTAFVKDSGGYWSRKATTSARLNAYLKWSYTAGDEFSGLSIPAIGKDGTVYAGNHDGKTPAIGADGTIYIGGFWDNNFYAVKEELN